MVTKARNNFLGLKDPTPIRRNKDILKAKGFTAEKDKYIADKKGDRMVHYLHQRALLAAKFGHVRPVHLELKRRARMAYFIRIKELLKKS